MKQHRSALAFPAICPRASEKGGSLFLPFACTKQPVWCCFLCCPVLSAVLWLLSARSLGPLPSQQHQTKRGLVAVRSLNSKLTSFLFLLFQKLLHLLVTKHRDLPGPVLAANTLTISMQTWRFLLKRVWSAGAPRIFAPARTPQKPQIFRKGIFAVLLYNAKASY